MKNRIFNEDCFKTMDRMTRIGVKCDVILTSPPYNTGRCCKTQRSIDNWENRYDVHLDNKSDEEYLNWTSELFNKYDKILNSNGVILYNLSYGNENPNVMWLVMSEIIKNTNFMVADCIIWKKKSALPNNVSHNKLTRITEFVFVLCRKSEYKTYNTNKQVKSISKTGQKFYENIFNFIEAKNNDGSCSLNKATFSSDLCTQLLNMYAKENSLIYDSFMGTGTTAVACKKMGLNYIGSELSENQCTYAENRIREVK